MLINEQELSGGKEGGALEMTATDRLKAEHESILSLLGILDRICERFKSKADIDAAYLRQAIEFMKVFIDRIHHGKEENLLFPLMRNAGGRRESVDVGELMIDHIRGRSLSRNMELAAFRYGKYDRDAPAEFVEKGKSYIGLLTEHIRRENEVYFPSVEMFLSEKQKKDLLDAFEDLDKTMVRDDSAMLQILQNLERIFPG